ncbi:MAG: putative DNA-binding transcriptional regulator AlpA [Flavobacterium sp.]|jgi:predicted DNA-binding transcriptional regulator AlpA
MNPLDLFQNLKNNVLLVYKEHHPYFEGTWKTFSSQDIQNLIELIETKVKQTVSEKWIYTHLKPETNEKLPRKDMLDILSQLVGFSGWDEYVFKNKVAVIEPQLNENKSNKNKSMWLTGLLVITGISAFIFYNLIYEKDNVHSLEVKDSYTNDKINMDDIKAVIVNDSIETPVEIINSELQIKTTDTAKVIINSPFYEKKEIMVTNTHPHPKIVLEPNDYAMMLKAFMKSDIKDWQTRKEQLDKIFSDDLEVIVMLKNNLGAEYFNKEEFSEKLIIPSASLKKMKVLEIKNEANKQINFIRIIQK